MYITILHAPVDTSLSQRLYYVDARAFFAEHVPFPAEIDDVMENLATLIGQQTIFMWIESADWLQKMCFGSRQSRFLCLQSLPGRQVLGIDV